MATGKPLQAGDLDRTCDILVKGDHLNTLGEIEATSYGPFLSGIPCKKDEAPMIASRAERVESDRETAFGIVEFSIRFRSDLNETMRLICEGIEYDIKNVREGAGRKQWTIITAEKHN